MRWIGYCWLFALLVGCTQTDQPKPPSSQFAVYIFDQTAINQFEAPNHNPTTALQTIDLTKASIVLAETDLLAYDWNNQQINIDKTLFSDTEQQLLFSDAYFVIVFNQQRIITGKRILEFAPTSYPYPVLSIQADSYQPNQPIQYALRNASLGVSRPPYPFLNPDPTIAEGVKAHFRKLGKLVD
ncbi:hypothetical protein [Herpetosiphon llansteffanensis]|uniref:hypothetical protein n=1 Tax=Herpetosiphon llansteffanensis TaxID=2094568 RepID=UPI000D7CB1B5|nr:hypothetical protein [Herpetosiphon llansteffanensis]